MRGTLLLLFTGLCLSTIVAHGQEDGTLPAQNYDFKAGTAIIFSDNFASDTTGEFPAHWTQKAGQAAVQQVAGKKAVQLIGSGYSAIAPRMSAASYLPKSFTLEFDLYLKANSYPLQVRLDPAEGDTAVAEIEPDATAFNSGETSVRTLYPESEAGDNFVNRWHHIEVAVNGPQLKLYVDKVRTISISDIHIRPVSLNLQVNAQPETPVALANIRLASGSGANVIGKVTTDPHIVTHDINFATGSAEITSASDAEINRIANILSANSANYEISGHTDNSGAPAKNLALSQQRAEAVKAALVAVGIDGARLTTKGYGDTRPLSPNTTADGKANNRRVELNQIN